MPSSKYIKLLVDNQQLDLTDVEDVPISISYKREDKDNFQSKKSSEALNITIPATVKNDQIANTFHNPGIDDMTPAETNRSFRKGLIEANGYELLVGKALLNNAKHNGKPVSYEFDFYGNNADWIIPLKEATLFDFLKHINFTFTKQLIIDSWLFDGTDELLPYVFAPVRYGQPFETSTITGNIDPDFNMIPAYMKPSLSVYWILYWGFKSIGYKIKSDFFETEYFRRQVMPWTWGNFLFSDGTRLENLGFLAKSTEVETLWNVTYNDYFLVNIGNDFTNGAYDNNGVYSADPGEMIWTYPPAFNYGILDGTFHIQVYLDATATANSHTRLYLRWFLNGVQQGPDDPIVDLEAPTIGRRDFVGIVDKWKTIQVSPGDIVTLKIISDLFDSGAGRANVSIDVLAFTIDYFRIPMGGLIDFESYNGLKKYKFLDFLAGILDTYNISPGTDPTNKVVTLEPEHSYSLTNDLAIKTGGYYTGNHLNWDEKQDLEKLSELSLFSDTERELLFRFKDDSNDGMLKKVQDRASTKVGLGKYAFPDRFKAGKKEIENRFFAAVIHVELKQWSHIDDMPVEFSPQIVTLIPENIANTSRDEAQNTFIPKLCYYKGMQLDKRWVFDDVILDDWPFMFAVNYQPGGEEDPVLSYSDEFIGSEGSEVIGNGLLRRFFLQRLAIMRNGQIYDTFFKLNNLDATNFLYREFIESRGQRWELVEIKDYRPLKEQTTGVLLRKWSPIAQRDSDNVFPSNDSVEGIPVLTNPFDLKYSKLKALSSDIPTITP